MQTEKLKGESGGSSQKESEFGSQHRVYGGDAALTFQIRDGVNGFTTVFIDGARQSGKDEKGQRRFDWDSKLTLQVTKAEFPIVLAVFAGMKTQCEFKYHGTQRNRGYEITRQKQRDRSGLFVRLFSPGGAIAVPVTPSDVFYISNLFFEAAIRQNKNLRTTTDVLNTLKTTVSPFLS